MDSRVILLKMRTNKSDRNRWTSHVFGAGTIKMSVCVNICAQSREKKHDQIKKKTVFPLEKGTVVWKDLRNNKRFCVSAEEAIMKALWLLSMSLALPVLRGRWFNPVWRQPIGSLRNICALSCEIISIKCSPTFLSVGNQFKQKVSLCFQCRTLLIGQF